MKKLIIILLSTLLIGSSLAAEQNLRQESVEHFTSKGIDANKTATLNVNEAMLGCEYTKEAFDVNQKGVSGVGSTYECKKDDNYFKDLPFKLSNSVNYVVAIILSIIVFISALIAFFQLVAALSSQNSRKFNAVKTFIAKVMKLSMIFLIAYIISVVVLGSMMLSTALGIKIANTEKFNQGTNLIPEFSSKNFRIENLLNYLICVKTQSPDSSQIADIKVFETLAQGLEIKANYGYCELSGSLALDTKGIEIAKHYDLFDYKQKQQEAAIAALQKLIVRMDAIATKIANSGNVSFGYNTFPEYTEGEQLYSLDVSGFKAEEINKYKFKANDYLSRDFIFELNKTPDISKAQIEEQVKTLKHRRINICSAEQMNPNHRLTLEEIRAQTKQCVSRNCGDITGSSSPYACSVALEKLQSISNDAEKDFIFLPAMRLIDKSSDYQSAKLMTGSINFQFYITDDVSYTVDMNKRLDSFKVSTEVGTISKSQFINILESGENLKEEIASETDSSSELINYFTTDEGLLSFDRFFTCLANPHKTVEGFNCKNFEYELEKQSLVLTFTALKLQTAKALYTNPWSYKRKGEKGLGVDYSAAASKVDLSALSKFIDKRQLALITPILFDTAGSLLFEDVYGENYATMVGDNGTFYALLALMASSEAGEQAITFIAATLHTTAQFLMYGHIIIPVMIFIYFLVAYFIDVIFGKLLSQISLAKSLSMNTSRKDLDKEDWYIQLEALAVKPILFTISFFASLIIFKNVLVIVIGDLREFTGTLFFVDYRASTLNEVIVIFLSLFLLTVFYVSITSLMKIGVEIGLNYMHGKGSDNDNRIQNADELREFSKTMKGKGL